MAVIHTRKLNGETGIRTYVTMFHAYTVYRFRNGPGDYQWMVDRDDKPCFAQCDTLSMVEATIVADTEHRCEGPEICVDCAARHLIEHFHGPQS